MTPKAREPLFSLPDKDEATWVAAVFIFGLIIIGTLFSLSPGLRREWREEVQKSQPMNFPIDLR